MGGAKFEHEGAIHHLPVNAHTSSSQQIAGHSGIPNESSLIKHRRNRHILIGHQLNFRQIFGELTIPHSITRGAVRGGCRLLPMKTRDDLLCQLDLDITRISTSADVGAKLANILLRPEAKKLEIAPHKSIRNRY